MAVMDREYEMYIQWLVISREETDQIWQMLELTSNHVTNEQSELHKDSCK